jgi:FkbH-like protein
MNTDVLESTTPVPSGQALSAVPLTVPSRSVRKELLAVFHHRRLALANALFDGLRQCSTALPANLADLEDWPREHVLAAVDIAGSMLGRPDELWEDLFAGWIHSRVLAPLSDGGAESAFSPSQALRLTKLLWLDLLRGQIGSAAVQHAQRVLDRVIADLSRPARKTVRVLFIGDCLQYEVIAALLGPCARAQIAFAPQRIHERVQSVLRNRIRSMEASDVDLVFFSPFTHSYLPEYSQLLRPASSLWGRARFFEHADRMVEDIAATVRVLANRFACPIYLHNTAGTVQTFGLVVGWAKNAISRRNRKQAREMIHRRFSLLAEEVAFEGRVRVLDENSVRDGLGDRKLATVFYKGDLFHPTRLGVALGRRTCFEAIYSHVFLEGKKVVVCDLDNTLWDGVIGEGAVTHLGRRQEILKGLRNRGILLSINSKNDPRNVHFSGGVLESGDFVAPRINWMPKAANMKSIVAELNMKAKDFVFIDDRSDELEQIADAFPEILTLNAQDPATWRLLSHWQKHLRADQDGDRTRLYHERFARDQFLLAAPPSEAAGEDELAALSRLGLEVKIEDVTRSGVKRAAELINRTSQFNLCGSRVTVTQLLEGLSQGHRVFTVTARDKFGGMGVVGAMKVDIQPGRLEIPVFVLSCRVFGFGIEYALLNTLSRLAGPDTRISGHYKETQHNQPCRELYPKSGFTWNGSFWDGVVSGLPENPAWLVTENRFGDL